MHSLSYLLKLIFYPVISKFNTDSFASSIIYISLFKFNISHSKPINLKSIKNDYEKRNSDYSTCRNCWVSILVTTTLLVLAQNTLTATVAHPTSKSDGTVSPGPTVHCQGRETVIWCRHCECVEQ